MKESESVYTLTEVHCFTNQVIYNDECVYVLIPTDERPKEMTKYFSMVDDVIINFCEIEIIASDRENHSGKALDRCFEISSYTISDVNVIKFQGTTPTIRIITEDRNDKLNPHQVVIDLEQTNVVTFVNNSPDPVRIQEVGENKIIDIPKTAWHTKTIESGEKLTMQFNSTRHYEFNVKKITDFLEGYFEHHATGDIVVLSNDTNSLPVEIRAKMAQSIVGSDFRKGVGLISVGSGGAEPGITIGIDEKFQHRPDAEQFYYEKYKKMIPFDVPIWIEFSAPIVLNG